MAHNSSGYTFQSGTRSDSSGYFFDAVPAGTYTLFAGGLSGSGTIYSQPNIVVNNDVTVNITLAAVSISPTSTIMDFGQSQLFNATAIGGSGTYTGYQWYVNGALLSDQKGSTFSFSPTSMGSYSVTATVTDNAGSSSLQSTSAAVIVNPVTPTPTPIPTSPAPTPVSSPIPTPTPTATMPMTTSTPTASLPPTASNSPSTTPNSPQGPNIETYLVLGFVVVIIVIAIGVVVFMLRKSKNPAKGKPTR